MDVIVNFEKAMCSDFPKGDLPTLLKLTEELDVLERKFDHLRKIRSENLALKKSGKFMASRPVAPLAEIRAIGAEIIIKTMNIYFIKNDVAPAIDNTNIGDAVIVDNKETNMVQIKFMVKPSDAMRQKISGAGWRWNMRTRAWQKARDVGVYELAVSLVGGE